MSRHLLEITRLKGIENIPFPGYWVCSTAPINVEDKPTEDIDIIVSLLRDRNVSDEIIRGVKACYANYKTSKEQSDAIAKYLQKCGVSESIVSDALNPLTDPEETLQEIVDYVQQHNGDIEILVLIHGYNTNESGAQYWYESACKDIARYFSAQNSPKLLVIGYRWSSEKAIPDLPKNLLARFKFVLDTLNELKALPKPLAIAGSFGFTVGLISLLVTLVIEVFKLVNELTVSVIAIFILIAALLVVFVILTIFLLRVSGYFRDSYRASNYGVNDFVEFIRQLDSKFVAQFPSKDLQQNQAFWSREENNDRRIRLNFVGHSMGAFVTTNAVRTLSDVFDQRSIGNLEVDNQKKCPSSNIGNIFRLSRLVLVAPDISAETLISGRANSLRSSLRRFDEAYLFSNEGDMTLKIASTAANYFSFPAKTRDGGYRLGNVIVRIAKNRGGEQTGIVNLKSGRQFVRLTGKDFLSCLFLRKETSLLQRQEAIGLESDQFIAELFTYFDCTDYQEQGKGIVTQALGKPFLSFWDYIKLILSGIDGHSSLIYNKDAEWSRRLIYGLSCFGLEKFLFTLDSTQSDKQKLLETLSNTCATKGIQVLLAAERYDVDLIDQTSTKPCDRLGY